MAAVENPDKMFYSMGEVSEMFDVKPSLIRFWEQKFDIIRPQKNKKGNRLFTPEDVRNLKVIYHLVKERRMTLAGAQKYMKASRHSIERDMELTERLQSIRALLAEVRDTLGDADALPVNFFEEHAAPETQAVVAAAPENAPAGGCTLSETVPTAEADALMREAIAELESDDTPEEMPDFEPESEPEEENMKDEEPEPETPPVKQAFVEQTLFDF